ncbi:MAG: hypothetical protein KJ057_17460 [Phycisphaerae bacterium]|nr:MAG: hypothetical protein F9K17_00020 [Phycisphaerae bacterium]MBE7456201.1 hypothetical protein [Planctomycetia bacterium]MCK6466431.1 hypothetical protein [Phycisphaerae bacterium]MCL4720254.1 hypothetical protein [Phycisphaerae bacterium]
MKKSMMCALAAFVIAAPAALAGGDVTRTGSYRADLMPYGEHVQGAQLPIVLGEGEEGPAGDCNVLIVAAADQVWADEVRNQLNSTGLLGPVDLYDARSGTPTLAQLQNYDSVLTFSDFAYADRDALGNVLADYVDGGGNVVQATFAFLSGIDLGGRWLSGGYAALNSGGFDCCTPLTLGTVHQPGHPVMAGVSSFNGGSSSYHAPTTVASGAIAIADWSNGQPLVAEMPGFNGAIFALNFYPPSSVSRGDFWDSNTDGEWLLANALAYGCGPQAPRCIYQVSKVKNKANNCGKVCDACPYVRGDLVCTNECGSSNDCAGRLKGFNACANGAACKVSADLIGCDIPPTNCKRCR